MNNCSDPKSLRLDHNKHADATVAVRMTASGTGGIALVRVVGTQAAELIKGCVDQPAAISEQPDRPLLARWMDGEEHIDDVILIADQIPAGVTVCCHGGLRVVERILLCLQRLGAVVLEQPEVRHALAELDPCDRALMQHLPRTQTPRVARWLIGQSRALHATVLELIDLLQGKRRTVAAERMHALIASFDSSNILLDGAKVVIAGPPNAGKSTLANQLFDRPWSTESAEAGTTRDWIRQPIAIDGIPMALSDTAGLRDTDDQLESMAIAQSRAHIIDADVQILVVDGSTSPDLDALRFILPLLRCDRALLVINKLDVKDTYDPQRTLEALTASGWPHTPQHNAHNESMHVLSASARTGEGLQQLRRAVLTHLGLADAQLPSPVIWDAQQREYLLEALRASTPSAQAAINTLKAHFLGKSREKRTRPDPIVE